MASKCQCKFFVFNYALTFVFIKRSFRSLRKIKQIGKSRKDIKYKQDIRRKKKLHTFFSYRSVVWLKFRAIVEQSILLFPQKDKRIRI